MTSSSRLRWGLAALCLGLASTPTLADDDCDAPVQRWQSREAVRQMAAQQGWQIQRLKIDDGCYEIRGQDAQGRAFKAKIDPETLKVVKMKRRDRNGDRDQDRRRERLREHAPQGSTPARTDAAAPASAPAPAPLFTPGTAPRGQVE